MESKLILGDSIKKLKKFDDNSIDLMCTDPPYGYSFMGKDWDKAIVTSELWEECFRVLKPGAFAFVMSAPRSDVQSRMIIKLEDAIHIVLESVRRNSVGSDGMLTDEGAEELKAVGMVEDFIDNVFFEQE